mmetsp:Transcript_19422/g.48404  ORF Transcript_19422/g.48404 Transcript_19422/m.48404 type:complete len:357 (-) Transcript_19422:82-1152(-)
MIESDCKKREQILSDKRRNPMRFNGRTEIATVVALLLSSSPFGQAYSYNAPSNRRSTFAFRRTTTQLFSSPDESNEGVPDISATQADIDFMSVHDVDWAEMDPFHELLFDEFEDLYLQGKAKGDPSATKTNPGCDASYESIMTEWDESVPTLNHISLVGRVGNPPEARYFDSPIGSGQGGNGNKPNVVVSMSLALPRYYSAWEREQYKIEYGQEETDWYNLEVWGVLAEFALKNVQKGSRIGVVGSIDTDYYRNKNNDMLSTAPKLLVQDLDILESKMEADARRNNGGGYGNSNYGGGGNNYNSNQNYGNNNNSYNQGGQQRSEERGPSFFTDDDGDDDLYDPSGGGSAGGFFDPT